MKTLFGIKAVLITLALLLSCSSAWAGCSIEQTASNEIVIRTSVGGCNGAALRENLAAVVNAGDAAQVAQAASRESALSGVKRSSGQSALWRLANMNNQAGMTSFTMPGIR
ncbi:MAG TPA: hypothetical protein VH105_12440 [Burkholderiales bacterium]|nr:hypothetical protein [Burkholderiales bacterium]